MKFVFRIVLLFSLCGIFSSAHAQTFQWAKGAYGTGSDEGWDIATDDSGNVYVTGFFQSPFTVFGVDTIFNHSGAYDVFLTKYDSTGNVLWTKSAGGANSDLSCGVATDDSGNVFIAGYFQSDSITFGSVTLNNPGGGCTIFIVKYDPAGNVMWAKNSVGSGGSDICYGVAADFSGNVYVSGAFDSPIINFGSITLVGAGGTDAFFAKYDRNGNVLWAKTPNSPGFDRGMAVATDIFGNVFFAGHYDSGSIHFGSVTLFNYSTGIDNAFLVKYDAAGNVQWAKTSYAAGANYAWGVATDHVGNSFITGRYQYSPMIIFDTDTLLNTGSGTDVFVVKYNPSGSVLWAKSGTGAGDNFGYDLAADSAGNVYVTGGYSLQGQSQTSVTFYPFTLPATSNDEDEMFIVKYDKGGNVLCATPLTGGGDDNNGIAIDPKGDIYVGGDFEVNPFILGSNTLYLTGYENVFVAKYIPCTNLTSISEQTNENGLKIYPNPSSGIFNFDFNETDFSKSQLILTDVLGKTIYQSQINNRQLAIDLSGNADGIYFYRIVDENKIIATGKLILH